MSGAERTPEPALSYWPADTSVPVLEESIGDVLRRAAAVFGPRTALVEGVDGDPRRWSHAALLLDAERVARALLARFRPGEHLAIFAANGPEWVHVEFGAALAGLTLVTINPAFVSKELAYVLGQSRASGILVQPAHRGRNLFALVEEARADLPGLRAVISLNDWQAFLVSGDPGTPLPEVGPLDIAQIQYTSSS
jgi:fatty-acyl-CoA synthase